MQFWPNCLKVYSHLLNLIVKFQFFQKSISSSKYPSEHIHCSSDITVINCALNIWIHFWIYINFNWIHLPQKFLLQTYNAVLATRPKVSRYWRKKFDLIQKLFWEFEFSKIYKDSENALLGSKIAVSQVMLENVAKTKNFAEY